MRNAKKQEFLQQKFDEDYHVLDLVLRFFF